MTRFSIRLPNGAYQWIKEQAAQNRRSMNAQLTVLIEEQMGLRSQASTGGLERLSERYPSS